MKTEAGELNNHMTALEIMHCGGEIPFSTYQEDKSIGLECPTGNRSTFRECVDGKEFGTHDLLKMSKKNG